ncbi:hypothetical protein DAKH74_005070 [Maudiozyma humilis]|uniref:phosphoinositide 5-phosphatase n=1 Tax=Maudiozyma humilis TaxID=51915 RepID=A0AAV5RTC6_MAUHU|nr:hypothetical protein DAKH74_005070 [Kazachstania humilis]
MLILLSTERRRRRIAVVSDTHALVFEPVRSRGNSGSGSDSNAPSCAVELLHKEELRDHRFRRLSAHEVHGFIGLVEIDGLVFIGVITGKTKVASPIPHEVVNRIYAVDFFCLNDSTWDFLELDPSGRPFVRDSAEPTDPGIPKHPCNDIRKLLSNGSFYYSNDFDLTTTLQNRGFRSSYVNDVTLEEEYMWNSFLMEDMLTYRDRLDSYTKNILDREGFLTTVIRGFAETFTTYVKRLKVGLTVISKQSWKRAGTRFNARGIDDDGNVANFVETEILMYSNEYCYAFTQVRGSVPMFWEQDAAIMNAKVQITRSLEATQPAFDQHFMKLVSKYGPVNIVNLLSTKPNEIELSKRYRAHLQQSQKLHKGRDVMLTEFDFHRETAQEGFNAARNILPLIKEALLTEGYYCYDVKQDVLVSEQHGVFRTNCLDCLDRTNLVQQMMSLQLLKTFLYDVELVPHNAPLDSTDLVRKHNSLWADQGDQISQIYTGTNALKSSFSRKGKMSLSGALSDAKKSVSRMYINNFMDKGKQQNIDALLGKLPNQLPVKLYDPVGEYINEKLKKLADQYTTTSDMNVLIGTYNVNGMSERADLSKWLFPIGNKFKPDLVVLGLQEVIELNAGNILNADYTKGSFWEYLVKECLNQYGEKYVLLRVEQMTSLIILFFARADKAKYVKRVEGSTKKTGFGGMTGNKGAIAIRFEYGSTSFCFVNAHFSAGNSNVDERANDYMTINRKISFARSRKIKDNDSIFWFGDLNYRVDMPNDLVRKELTLCKEGYLDRLIKHDQLTQQIDCGAVFHDYCEPTIHFHPTYKFDHGTDIYDTSEKMRTPSWTDRIVYKGNNLHPLAYSCATLKVSDHRPVYAAYRTDVNFIDEEKKLELSKSLYEDFKMVEDNIELTSTFSTDDEKDDIELEQYLKPAREDINRSPMPAVRIETSRSPVPPPRIDTNRSPLPPLRTEMNRSPLPPIPSDANRSPLPPSGDNEKRSPVLPPRNTTSPPLRRGVSPPAVTEKPVVRNDAPPPPPPSHHSSSASLVSLQRRNPRDLPEIPPRQSYTPTPPISRNRYVGEEGSKNEEKASDMSDKNSTNDEKSLSSNSRKSTPTTSLKPRKQTVLSDSSNGTSKNDIAQTPLTSPAETPKDGTTAENKPTLLQPVSAKNKSKPPVIPKKKSTLENVPVHVLTKKTPPMIPKKKDSLRIMNSGN